jgi:plastocyanin
VCKRGEPIVTAVRIAIICAALALGALPGAATPPHFAITIENAAPYFSPVAATVATGTSIRWDNPTPTEHTITHDGCIVDGPCAFDSSTMLPNAHYTVPSLPPGRYPYHCRVHPIMRGTLTVTDAATSPQI